MVKYTSHGYRIPNSGSGPELNDKVIRCGGPVNGCSTCMEEVNDDLFVGDSVNHPSHYNTYRGLEVIDLVEQMNFNRGNAVKYITRAGLKNPDSEVEDIEKAIWYLDRELKRLRSPEDGKKSATLPPRKVLNPETIKALDALVACMETAGITYPT